MSQKKPWSFCRENFSLTIYTLKKNHVMDEHQSFKNLHSYYACVEALTFGFPIFQFPIWMIAMQIFCYGKNLGRKCSNKIVQWKKPAIFCFSSFFLELLFTNNIIFIFIWYLYVFDATCTIFIYISRVAHFIGHSCSFFISAFFWFHIMQMFCVLIKVSPFRNFSSIIPKDLHNSYKFGCLPLAHSFWVIVFVMLWSIVWHWRMWVFVYLRTWWNQKWKLNQKINQNSNQNFSGRFLFCSLFLVVFFIYTLFFWMQ